MKRMKLAALASTMLIAGGAALALPAIAAPTDQEVQNMLKQGGMTPTSGKMEKLYSLIVGTVLAVVTRSRSPWARSRAGSRPRPAATRSGTRAPAACRPAETALRHRVRGHDCTFPAGATLAGSDL